MFSPTNQGSAGSFADIGRADPEHQQSRYKLPAAVIGDDPQVTIAPLAEISVKRPNDAKRGNLPSVPQVSKTKK
jgi:hypothetical protein